MPPVSFAVTPSLLLLSPTTSARSEQSWTCLGMRCDQRYARYVQLLGTTKPNSSNSHPSCVLLSYSRTRHFVGLCSLVLLAVVNGNQPRCSTLC
ncbi:hypothetical protein C8F01DRAFT_1162116 [Mycena amicta]|nr:hypothetical protein C8F01DRAFT_1162116 [Mycena amicta]